MVPAQEPGVRQARALPYALDADGAILNGMFVIDFRNSGTAAAVFQVRSALGAALPRTYTVEAGKDLSDAVPVVSGAYDVFVYGPNGFFRRFKGKIGAGQANLSIRPTFEDDGRGAILLTIRNLASLRAHVTALDKYSGDRIDDQLRPGESFERYYDLKRFHNWYDVVVTVEGDGFEYECAGHIEDGHDSFSDPMMGRVVRHG
jgi:phospholipase C